MHCAWCQKQMGYVHGHAACLQSGCPMFGQNQAECCAGDVGGCLATSQIAAVPSRGLAQPVLGAEKPGSPRSDESEE